MWWFMPFLTNIKEFGAAVAERRLFLTGGVGYYALLPILKAARSDQNA
jgi:hypothetical protein